MLDCPPLRFAQDGAEIFSGAIAASLDRVRSALAPLLQDAAGVRISGLAALRPYLLSDGPIGAIAAEVIGPGCQAVRAILFDKTAKTNWSLAWHQDRTISVRQKLDVDGFGPWTKKAGMHHVAPPFDLLSRMVTLRIHLDDVAADNGPLLIAPGSHRFGLVPASRIAEVVDRCGARQCLAAAGDIWLYATPILHASDSAATPRHRRVLQVDFSADHLPSGLEWSGV